MSTSADEPIDELPPFPGVEPKPGTAKSIGTLCIVFACLLLLCCSCPGIYSIAGSASMEPMMAAQKQQMQAQFEAQRAARIEELQDREKRAQTDKEKADIQAE